MIPKTNVLCCMVKNYDQLWDVVLSLESPHCNPSRISDMGDVVHLGLKTLFFFSIPPTFLCVCALMCMSRIVCQHPDYQATREKVVLSFAHPYANGKREEYAL
jgi:hypothetical protein